MGKPVPQSCLKLWGRNTFYVARFLFWLCVWKNFFWAQQIRGDYASPLLRVWGKSWLSKFCQKNYQKRWTTVSTLSTWLKQELLINEFFSLLCEETGSEHQSLLFSYVCSLAFTGQSSCKTVRAAKWKKSVQEVRTTIICVNTLKMIFGLINLHLWPTYLNTWMNWTLKCKAKMKIKWQVIRFQTENSSLENLVTTRSMKCF